MRRAQLVGSVFGRLTVEADAGNSVTPNGVTSSRWLCRCECGNTRVVIGRDLKCGKTRSCGCLRSELVSARRFKHGKAGSNLPTDRPSREYEAWAHAKQRCTNPRNVQFENYGGRGIRMCDEWANDFRAFFADMGECPEGKTIDRIDNDGNYEPGNCRWATDLEQKNNRSDSRYVVLDGERMTVAEASRRAGIDKMHVYGRLNKGWSLERALSWPVNTQTPR